MGKKTKINLVNLRIQNKGLKMISYYEKKFPDSFTFISGLELTLYGVWSMRHTNSKFVGVVKTSEKILDLFKECGGAVWRVDIMNPKSHVHALQWVCDKGLTHFYCVMTKLHWIGTETEFKKDCFYLVNTSRIESKWMRDPKPKVKQKTVKKESQALNDFVKKAFNRSAYVNVAFIDGQIVSGIDNPEDLKKSLKAGGRVFHGSVFPMSMNLNTRALEYHLLPSKYEWLSINHMGLKHLQNMMECVEEEGFSDIKEVMSDINVYKRVKLRINELIEKEGGRKTPILDSYFISQQAVESVAKSYFPFIDLRGTQFSITPMSESWETGRYENCEFVGISFQNDNNNNNNKFKRVSYKEFNDKVCEAIIRSGCKIVGAGNE